MIKHLIFTRQAPDLATKEKFQAIEAKLNLRFPETFVEFYSRWNGGFPGAVNEFYPVPPTFREFHDEYKMSQGVCIDKLFGITDEFLQCSIFRQCNGASIPFSYIIPITSDLFGDQVVLRANSIEGMVYWLDHELWETVDDPNEPGKTIDRPRLFPIARDLESFYNSLTFAPDK